MPFLCCLVLISISFHVLRLELFTVSPGCSAPGPLPSHVLRSGEHQLALFIAFRIHRFSPGVSPWTPSRISQDRNIHGLPMFVHPPPGPAHMSGSRSVNPHPSPALCLFRKIEQAQMQRRSSEPAAAHIQGVDPPFPVCAAENSPAHARLTHPPPYFETYPTNH